LKERFVIGESREGGINKGIMIMITSEWMWMCKLIYAC
jgi:hypothetical protein